MPKKDYQKVIDTSFNPEGRPAATPEGARYSAGGMADKLDGYDASLTPLPFTIPVLDENAKLSPDVLPESALAPEQITGFPGQWYIAPNVLLADDLLWSDVEMTVNQPDLLAVGDNVILSHYRVINEQIKIVGGPAVSGRYWSYSIERAQNNTTARTFPRGAWALNLGTEDDGGYIVVNSGDRANTPTTAPHINMYGWENGEQVHKLRLGRLRNLPDSFRSQFPWMTDEEWAALGFGLAGTDVILSGIFRANGGAIYGNMDIIGRLTVRSDETNAQLRVGDTESGWGVIMLSNEGRPVWSLITPFTDENGNTSDLVWYVEIDGERAVYLRHDESLNSYRLTLGGFDVTAHEIAGYATDGKRMRLSVYGDTPRLDLGSTVFQDGYISHPRGLDLNINADLWFNDAARVRFSREDGSDIFRINYQDPDQFGTWPVEIETNVSVNGDMRVTGAMNVRGTLTQSIGTLFSVREKDPQPMPDAYTFLNAETLRTLNNDSLTVGQLADVVFTIWGDLMAQGILQ